MAKGDQIKQTSSITCPHCGAASTGSYTTVVKADESGPTKVLYKCSSCGKFYTAEKVVSVSWRVTKS